MKNSISKLIKRFCAAAAFTTAGMLGTDSHHGAIPAPETHIDTILNLKLDDGKTLKVPVSYQIIPEKEWRNNGI